MQFIEIKEISKYKFYKETGITRGILDQNNGMPEENITKFLSHYSEVNPEWLLTGKGEMIRSETSSISLSPVGNLNKIDKCQDSITQFEMKQRLLRIAASNNMSVRRFEEYVGLNRGNISNMAEDAAIGSDKLAKIVVAFPNVSIEWLLTGKGKMLCSRGTAKNEHYLIDKQLDQIAEILDLFNEDLKLLAESNEKRDLTIEMLFGIVKDMSRIVAALFPAQVNAPPPSRPSAAARPNARPPSAKNGK